jgi:hypothetical protein
VPEVSQVHVMYRARLVGGFGVGVETLEAQLVAEAGIPWAEIAFPSVRFALERFCADRRAGAFVVHRVSVARR